MNRGFPQRTGIATITALVLLAMITATLAVTAKMLKSDLRRSEANQVDAQLRQLLLAGADAVVNQSHDWPEAVPSHQWTVPLPDDVARDGAQMSVEITSTQDDEATAEITAILRGRRMDQELNLRRTDGRWELKRIQLNG